MCVEVVVLSDGVHDEDLMMVTGSVTLTFSVLMFVAARLTIFF